MNMGKSGAIWLRREGKDVVVLIERDGQWIEVIREFIDCNFSHIVERPGEPRQEVVGEQS